MLHNTKRKSVKPALKLFPRLATARAIRRPVRIDRLPVDSQSTIVAMLSKRDAEARRVRARLLQMILDNERVRRNDWRPNAS